MNSTHGSVVSLTMFCLKCFENCLDAPTYSIFEWLRGSSWKKKKGNILRKIFASINHYYQPHDMNTADRRPLPLQKNVVQNSFSFTLCMEKCRFQGVCISVEVFLNWDKSMLIFHSRNSVFCEYDLPQPGFGVCFGTLSPYLKSNSTVTAPLAGCEILRIYI